MNEGTVIVGAGLSGLVLARILTETGAQVTVLEKSRGVGGRIATKRIGTAIFDQGAQFVEGTASEFVQLMHECRDASPMPPLPHRMDNNRWFGQNGITDIPKCLAKSIHIEKGHRVSSATYHDCGCWELAVEDGGIISAGRLVLTAPVPQSLEILRQGGVTLPASLETQLTAIVYRPCIAMMLCLDAPSMVPATGLIMPEGPVGWIMDNVKKGVRQITPGALTVLATTNYSRSHYGDTESAIIDALLPAVRPWLAGASVTAAAIHRWKYSEAENPLPVRHVWLPQINLGFAGDSFGGTGVENAALSGFSLAQAIVPDLKRDS